VLHDQWLSEKFDYSRKAHPSVIKDVYRVTIPPLSVQESVVKTLDSFSALVGGVTGGLPAEIAARRQQYEYYRDRLFDFPRLAA
jgi:type I restriction enzyme S subunit